MDGFNGQTNCGTEDKQPENDRQTSDYTALGEAEDKSVAKLKGLDSYRDIKNLTDEIAEELRITAARREAELNARRLQYLRAARVAPRCHHVKPNGQRCGSPAMGGEEFCYFHNLARMSVNSLPILEDRRAVQVAFMRVCERLMSGSLSASSAKVMLQALSMAQKNGGYLEQSDE